MPEEVRFCPTCKEYTNDNPTCKICNTTTNKLKPIRRLQCCCCGSGTIGRQWWNRDTGFGLCPSCADWIAERGKTSADEMKSFYGVRGIHYDVGAREVKDGQW